MIARWYLERVVLALLLGLFALSSFADVASAETRPGADFNHAGTGFPLTGAHRNTDCATCHVGGMFIGTPRDCAGCHSRGARVVATIMPANHLVTTSPCENCHTDTATFLGARFNHSGVVPGACTSCHNGRITTGKPASHNNGLRTTDSCDKCHRTYTWMSSGFDHMGVLPGNCASQCHNGGLATGRPASHTTALKSTGTCDTCHRVLGWFPTFYNHAGVVPGSCATCHNGASATAKPASHTGAKASMACDSCHTTVAWLPAIYNHIGVLPGTCLSCHAAQRPTSHITRGYTASCDECHTTGASWVFNHAMQQGRHTCNLCHSGHHNSTPCDYCHSVNGWGGGD